METSNTNLVCGTQVKDSVKQERLGLLVLHANYLSYWYAECYFEALNYSVYSFMSIMIHISVHEPSLGENPVYTENLHSQQRENQPSNSHFSTKTMVRSSALLR